MQAIIERCCGLDVHQETLVACLLVGAPGARANKEVRTFRTVTRDLEALRDWLLEAGVTHVGMESTGVYWRPVYAVLEGFFELIVGNARHIRNVPGRKTDVKDSEWIADLVRHGLIAKSFVPPPPLRELRELLRYRRKLVESQAAERNRLLKLLETANIKLASVASDVFGVSGRAMLRAMIAGEASAEAMADLAKGQLRRKRVDLILALDGRLEEHHRFLLAMQLRRLEAIEADIAALDRRIGERLEPYSAAHALLMQIPGVDWVVAAVLIAEIGVDMSVFLSVYHLSAWAGVCPGNHESAGRQKSGRARKGNIHLRTILVTGANSRAGHSEATVTIFCLCLTYCFYCISQMRDRVCASACPGIAPVTDPRRRCDLRLEDQGQLPQGQVPPPEGPPRRSPRRPRHRPQDPRVRLSHACEELALPRSR